MYPYFHVMGAPVSAYGTMSVLGILAMIVYCVIANRRGFAGRLSWGVLFHLFLLCFLAMLVGARALYALTMLPIVLADWAYFSKDIPYMLHYLFNGMVFYGGMLAAVSMAFWYHKRYKIAFGTIAGIFTPSIPLFHFLGRVGCFLGGCCWGIEFAGGIVYTSSLGAPNGVPLFPVQLLEAACNLLLFLFLAAAARKWKEKTLVLPCYLFSYAVLRFILEFLRGDESRGVFLLSTSQWISLFIVAAVAVWAGRRRSISL